MLYTTIPLARSQSTSQVFLDHDITNEAPGTVSDLRISIVTTTFDYIVAWYFHILWMVLGAWYTERPVQFGKTTNIMGSRSVTGLFKSPPMIVTFPSKVSEETAAKLAELGFIIQTKGNYKYYKGPASEENARVVVALGGQADAYAEYGAVNVNGFLSFLALDSILNGLVFLLGQAKKFASDVHSQPEVDKAIRFFDAWSSIGFITEKESIEAFGIERGILFPYFAGLVLPDKAMPVKYIIDKFHRALGNTAQEIARNCTILNEGWLSLSTSGTGCAISHLVYGISLAMDGGLDLHVVQLQGQYSGFVLSGKGFAVMKGKTLVKPVDGKALADQIGALNKHDDAISIICTLLSGVELRTPVQDTVKDAEGKEIKLNVMTSRCSPISINTPRKLYNAFSLRKLTPDNIKALQKEVLKLEYTQTFWSTTDQKKIALAATLICSRGHPSEDAPMAYKSSALYNLDPVASVLSAFGPIAPTLIGADNGNGLVNLTPSGRMYEETKGFTLRGCPIFVGPLQKAIEDWNTVLRTGLVRFKHAGNDRVGQAKISGKHTIVMKGTEPYNTIINGLKGIAKSLSEQTKKRKMVDTPVDPRVEEERQSKKAKKDNILLAILSEPEKGMDVDTVEEF